MERLRFDPYAPASARYPSRRIGDQSSAGNAAHAQSAAARARGTKENSVRSAADQMPQQENLARAFIIPQESVFPQFEPCDGWRRGSMFTSLEKPLEGVNRCGTR